MNEQQKKLKHSITASRTDRASEAAPEGIPNSTMESIARGTLAPTSAML